MTCHELDERLDDWVDGALPAAAASEVEAHLLSCALCRERERRLRHVLARHALRDPGPQVPAPSPETMLVAGTAVVSDPVLAAAS
jgi:anti-sigma factor RsiW